jgi:hypothetical protein
MALVLALPVVASAQTSRVEGMALQGDYIKDYTNIYTFPTCLPQIGNMVYGELGNNLVDPVSGHPSTLDRSVGVVMDKLFGGEWGTWGIHIREQTANLGQGDAFSNPGPGQGADPNEHLNESFDLMWGKKIGTTTVGLRLNRSFAKLENVAGAVTTTLESDITAFPGAPSAGSAFNANLARNLLGVGGGIGFQLNPNTNVELSILYQNRTYEHSLSTAGSNKYTDDGGATYMLAGRAMWQWQPNVMVVPVFKYYSFDLSQKESVPALSWDNSFKGWQIGTAGNWTLGTNDLLVMGVTFAQNKLEQQVDVFGVGLPDTAKVTEKIMPQVFAALETHVNHWLTLRFGANKGAYQKIKLEDNTTPNSTTEITFASFNMNIGAGVKIGSLQLDAILSNNFPQNMGWLGSGIAQSYFPKVTATYPF